MPHCFGQHVSYCNLHYQMETSPSEGDHQIDYITTFTIFPFTKIIFFTVFPSIHF